MEDGHQNNNSENDSSSRENIKVEKNSEQNLGTSSHSNKNTPRILLTILLLVLIAAGFFTFYHLNYQQNTNANIPTKANSSNYSQSSVNRVTDTWTGTGPNNNWSSPGNWSNGVPQSNYNLVFKVASAGFTANNNLNNLVINKLTFEGGNSSNHKIQSISITGNPISLSGGLTDNAASNVVTAIELNITLTSNQVFNINGSIGFVQTPSSLNSTQLNLDKYTLSEVGKDGLNYNVIDGQGKILINTSLDTAFTDVSKSSPNFSGSIVVSSGILNIYDGYNLGTATIVVNKGGALRIETGSSNASFSNNIDLAGNGPMNHQGQPYGAINVIGYDGYTNNNITFSGTINLTSNAKVGIYNSTTNNPGTGSGTLTFSHIKNQKGYTLKGLAPTVIVKAS